MNKTDLITKIKFIVGFTSKEQADLIKIINTKKSFGIMCEDKVEAAEDDLRQNLNVLKRSNS